MRGHARSGCVAEALAGVLSAKSLLSILSFRSVGRVS
jgi:hypothetical protein